MKDTIGALALFAAIYALLYAWDSPLRYQLQYSAEAEMVSVEKEPHDCDFVSAPLGSKGCQYHKEVSVVRFGPDTQTRRPVASYDDGRTWVWNDGGPIRGAKVRVWWRKETE